MLALELRGKVGVAPGTTTITVPAGRHSVQLVGPTAIQEITEGQYRYETIQVAQRNLEIRRKSAIWGKLGAIGTGGLATLALLGALAAWVRTGRIQAVK